MRSTCLFLLLTFGCLALFAAPAWSGGVGGSFSYGDGDGDVDDTDDFFPDLDTSADYFEVGFTYDSNLAADRLFNYRMSANLQIVEQDLSHGPHLGKHRRHRILTQSTLRLRPDSYEERSCLCRSDDSSRRDHL